MSTVNFNIRMDENLKKQAFPIIESYGLTPAQAVKLFFNQVVATNKLPLSFDYQSHEPNKTTQLAMQELIDNRKTRQLKAYEVNSIEDFNAVVEKIYHE